MCPALTRGVTSLCGQQVEWLSNTRASRWHRETLGRSALCFKSPSVCCIMGLFTPACVSHLPLLNPGQSPSRFPGIAGAQTVTPLHIFISSAVPLRLIFFYFSSSPSECGVLSLWYWFPFSLAPASSFDCAPVAAESSRSAGTDWFPISHTNQPPRLIDKLRIDIPFKKKKRRHVIGISETVQTVLRLYSQIRPC